MAPRGKKAAAPKKKANGYKMPPPIPLGEVIQDTIGKKKWRIGPSIGVGGFGEIYVACDDENPPKKGGNYPYVIKIEPQENGPLFVEKHFYTRNANKDDIQNFMKSKKLSRLGMPGFYGSGSHEYRSEKFRYLVLERYGTDVWKTFMEAGRRFPEPTVFLLGLQMLDVLEYIHSRGYTHGDLKGSNIMMGIKKGSENQAYLLDFGLAQRVNEKEFKPDPKNAHVGTIEYTSRDAHLGVPTMRGDLEILGYNMLQWLVGALPWETVLTQQKKVQEMKEDLLSNVRAKISAKYPLVPDALIKFFEYVNTLKPKEQPDYTKCRQIFESYLKSVGKTRSSKLEFTSSSKKIKKPAVGDESDDDLPLKQNGNVIPNRGRKPKAKPVKSDSENDQPDSDPVPVRGRKPKAKPVESDSETDQPDSDPVPVRGRKPRAKPVESDSETDQPDPVESDSETDQPDSDPVPVRGRKPKAKPVESDSENDQPDSDPVPVRGRKPKAKPVKSDSETDQPDSDPVPVKKTVKKRKFSEHVVVAKAKKTKLTPKATPPVKKNHANIATQTSGSRPARRNLKPVTFVSPTRTPKANGDSVTSINSSGDIFEDSFEIQKVKPKRKLLAEEEVTQTRVVKKKVVTAKKGTSWKNLPSVVNGRSPPK